jgi:hypothetical protein
MGPISGVVPPMSGGAKSSPAVATSKCSEPECNVSYHGGPVVHSPRVYLVFWGPKWKTSGADYKYITSFYRGLGTSKDNWSRITTQYGDHKGHPKFSGSVLARIYMDRVKPPKTVSIDTLANLAVGVANRFKVNRANSEIVILAQSGTCYTASNLFAGSCGTFHSNGLYCGWHAATSNGVLVTNVPYQPDAGRACGVDWLKSGGNNRYEGFSVVGGHEFAETITDPKPESGWIDLNDVNISGGEIADKCAWGGEPFGLNLPKGFLSLPTGKFAVQSLWSNKQHGCRMAY